MTKGFTLLEALVTILIFSFIIVGIFGLLYYARSNYDTGLASLNLQRQARQGMSWLSREIRQASWASLPTNAVNAITFNTPDANSVNYAVINTVVSGQTLWQLRRTCPASADEIRANDITGLTFSKNSGLGVQIGTVTVQASKTFSSGGTARTLTFSLSEQVEVRNP